MSTNRNTKVHDFWGHVTESFQLRHEVQLERVRILEQVLQSFRNFSEKRQINNLS
jgi:hypothetical protein